MRDYFFNINQKEAVIIQQKYLDGKGKSKINIEDFVLIRRIGDFILSSKTINVILENEIYHWINYKTVQEDLPLIFPSMKSLKKRVEKLKKIGILTNKKLSVKKEDYKKLGFKLPGNYSVIQFPREIRKLFDIIENNDSKPHEGVKGKPHEGVKACTLEGVNKEYLESNTKKKNNNIEDLSKITNKIKSLFENNNFPISDQTIRNIVKLKVSMERIEKVLSWAITNDKDMGAIYNVLKDKTPLRKTKGPTKLSDNEKIKFMKDKLNDKEIYEIKEKAALYLISIGEENPTAKQINQEFEFRLCQRYRRETQEVGKVG